MFLKNGPVVVVQLVERPLPIPDVHGSNLAIVKNLNIEHLFTVNCIEKTKKGTGGREWPILKIGPKLANFLKSFTFLTEARRPRSIVF